MKERELNEITFRTRATEGMVALQIGPDFWVLKTKDLINFHKEIIITCTESHDDLLVVTSKGILFIISGRTSRITVTIDEFMDYVIPLLLLDELREW